MPRANGSIDMVGMKIPNPVDKYVGSRVRVRRMMLNMSQTDLAHGIGLSFQQVQKYEKGSNRMAASRLQQMADILQVRITFFFDGAPNQSKIGGKGMSDRLCVSGLWVTS